MSDIVIIDDNPDNLNLLAGILREHEYRVRMATSPRLALLAVRKAPPDLILLDISMPEMDGYEVCRQLKADAETSEIPVIFLSAYDAPFDKVKAFQAGGVDYVTKPFQAVEVMARIENQLKLSRLQHELVRQNVELKRKNEELIAAYRDRDEHKRVKEELAVENLHLHEVIKSEAEFGDIISGYAASMKRVLQKVGQVAGTDSTVLITGETGTGKELIARAIHDLSRRKDQVLVKVNCAALPSGLIESELFGHEKGAFTGAISRKLGRFELADRGTIFLDEIGDLPLDLQAKLLRVLQDGEFERLGGTQTIRVNARVIAATNRDLERAIREEKYRPDLFYRLNVFPIHLPPLRERTEDIPVLIQYFAIKYGKQMGKTIESIAPPAMEALAAYGWPGNVRELENLIERAVIISQGPDLDLGEWLPGPAAAPQAARIETLEESERAHIRQALEATGWRVSGPQGAAALLGMKPTTLEARMNKLGVRRSMS